MFADQNLHLGELNKASAEGWQALSQEDKDHFQSRAAEEQVSLCPKVDLKQILNQLSKLVCQIYLCMLITLLNLAWCCMHKYMYL